MRAKPKNPSPHHGAFGRMRLRYDGLLTRDNGALLHRFEMSDMHGRWTRTALGKLRAHLGERGYEQVQVKETKDNLGDVSSRIYVFRNGSDEVQARTYAEGRFEKEERVHTVEHYPDGPSGDGRLRVTLGQIISAMCWGAVPA